MRVLLVDDHSMTRKEMSSLIGEYSDLDIIGEASSAVEAVEKATALHPDVVVMDLVMPGMNGIDATRKISAECGGIQILALSNHSGKHMVQAVMRAGANGYVRKDHAFEELIPAIRCVAGGGSYIGSEVND